MKQESGNVLFFILIGILLFGALTYTVSDSGNTQATTEREEMESAIAELYHYASSLGRAVQKVRLMGGCEDTDIDFHVAGENSSNYEHANENVRCKIFHPRGGAMSYEETPIRILENTASNQYRFTGQQSVSGIGTSAADLIFGARITRAACLLINDNLGIENPAGNPPVDNDTAGSIDLVFNGGRTSNGGYNNSRVLDHANIRGRQNGCVYNNSDDYYFYYQVLIAR